MDINTRIRNAAIKYLRMTDREVIDPDFHGIVVFKEDNETVFASLSFKKGSFDKPAKLFRNEFEDLILEFLKVSEDDECLDTNIRYDILNFAIVKDDRAIIQHIINAGFEED